MLNHNEQIAELTTAVKQGDRVAEAQLFQKLEPGLRFLVCRKLGPAEADRVITELFAESLIAIRAGRTSAVAQYVLGELDRRVEVMAVASASPRLQAAPHPGLTDSERSEDAMAGFTDYERAAMRMYYCDGSSTARICANLGFSEDDFERLRQRVREAIKKTLPIAKRYPTASRNLVGRATSTRLLPDHNKCA